MRARLVTLVLVLLVAACGGGGDGADAEPGQDTDPAPVSSADLPDPCTLIDDVILDGYFDTKPEPEPSGSGAFLSCSWSDENADSILVSVATSSKVNHPDPCPGCIDLSYGDDGYASSVPLQSSAEFVIGGTWFSVTTTGLGDGVEEIAALGEKVSNAAGG